jgi:hypothetical protein
MKKLMAFLAVVMLMLMLAAGSAMANPSEWGVIYPTQINGSPTYNDNVDFGYFIWTDYVERNSWHIRWMDGTHDGTTTFSGEVALQNATGTFVTFSFENNDNIDIQSDAASWFSKVINQQDGIDFTIAQTSKPSYVGFDLNYQSRAMDPSNIFLGVIEQTVSSLGEDQDFAIAAPVPEPVSLLLLGLGLVGLAGIRRKFKG